MDNELIFWVVSAVVCAIAFVAVFLPWNDKFDPKGDDPYKYCPKEEE